MVIDSFMHGPYLVKIHRSRHANAWAYRVSLSGQRLEAHWMSAASAGDYARRVINWRLA